MTVLDHPADGPEPDRRRSRSDRRAVRAVDGIAAALQPVLGVLVALVFSMLIARNKSRGCADLYMAMVVLLEYGATPVPGGAPPLWSVPPARGRHPWTTLNHLRVTREVLRKDYRRTRRALGPRASIDTRVINELVWREVRPALAMLISDGPEIAAERLDLLLEDLAERERPGGEHDAPRRYSRSLVDNVAAGARRVLRAIVELADRGVSPEVLAAWRGAAPKITVPRDCSAERQNRSAPPNAMLRRFWVTSGRDLDARLERRLGESRLEAIQRLSGAQLRARGVFRLLRVRAFIVLLACVGLRIDAACRLRRCDLVADCRRPDGSHGPAIDARPGKTLPADELRRKHLSPDLLAVLLEFEETVRRIADHEGSVWSPSGALLPGTTKAPDRFPAGRSVRRVLGGEAKQGVRCGGVLHRPDGGGFTPHSLRRLCLQNVRRGGRDPRWAARLDGVSPEAVSEVVVDHKVRVDPLSYADLDTREGREHWTMVGIQIAWEMLDGELGAARVRDVASFTSELAAREQLLVERGRLVERIGDAPPTGSQLVELQDLLRALEACERQLEWLRTADDALVPAADDEPPEQHVLDLGAIEGVLLDAIRRQQEDQQEPGR